MRKKILIVEQSDAIRNIAESLLHQNGYDVIAAPNAERAREMIITAEPNMIIVGGDITDSDGKYFYEILGENSSTSAIPLLLIADPGGRQLPYPEEVILSRPFDPKDFIDKVRLFGGGGTDDAPRESVAEVDPFSSVAVDDEFLDAALGLDNINVESSEVLDETKTIERSPDKPTKQKKPREFGIANSEYNDKDTETGETGRVESLMIREDGSTHAAPKPKPEDLSASSKLEIPTDQYGIGNPDEPADEAPEHPAANGKDHDYDWFIEEMQKDVAGVKFDNKPAEAKDQPLETTSASEGMETIKPPASDPVPETPDRPEIKPGGVDQFITEFKKEMDVLNQAAEKMTEAESDDTPEAPAVSEPPRESIESADQPDLTGEAAEEYTAAEQKSEPAAEPPPETQPPLDDENVNRVTDLLLDRLAEKLARQLVDKIGREQVAEIVKDILPQAIVDKK